MRYALFIAAAALALSAFVTAPAQAYDAVPGQTSKSANLRSGPSDKYEIIGKIGAGQQLHIVGCSHSWEWCDVQTNTNKRGWVAARFLLGRHEGYLAGVINYGAKMGVQEIAFDEHMYWGQNYSNTAFYKKRYGIHDPSADGRDHYSDNWDRGQPGPQGGSRWTWSGWRNSRVTPSDTVRINN